MRQRCTRTIVLAALGSLIAASCIGVAGVAATTGFANPGAQPVGLWHPAITVPGIVALNKGGYTELDAESCTSQGNCSAGGEYRPIARSTQMSAFVATEVNGTWGATIDAPGIAALDTGKFAQLHAMSCASPGNCTAGGGYRMASGAFEAFLISQVHGTWQHAFEVSGIGALNAGGTSSIGTMSCPSIGNCSTGGDYTDGSGHVQAFMVDEVHGVWGTAVEVPGTAALNIDGNATVDAISCASAGNCAAGGGFKDGSASFQAYLDNEENGVWGTAVEVPGTSTLNAGGLAAISAVSCQSDASCSAGGDYRDGSFHNQVFVVNEVGGVWMQAMEVPGSGALNAGGNAQLVTLSCGAPGECSAGGSYTDLSNGIQSLLVNETGGTWTTAFEVAGTKALNVEGGGEGIAAVSCIAPGTCAAGGDYQDAFGGSPVYVLNEVHGVWGMAQQLPGAAALNTGDSASIFALSCTASGWCGAGGNFLRHSGQFEDLVSWFFPAPSVARVAPLAGPTRGGNVTVILGLHLGSTVTVRFGARLGTHVHIVNGGEVRVMVPPGTGNVLVRVTTQGGVSLVSSHTWYHYLRAPMVTSISPSQGKAKGGTSVVIHGDDLLYATQVLFGPHPATMFVVLSAHAIRATAPAGGGRVHVQVRTPGGSSVPTVDDRFTYHA
jgi:hypothetical protein